jgi:hypothetical protein
MFNSNKCNLHRCMIMRHFCQTKKNLSILIRMNNNVQCIVFFFLVFLYKKTRLKKPSDEEIYFKNLIKIIMFKNLIKV